MTFVGLRLLLQLLLLRTFHFPQYCSNALKKWHRTPLVNISLRIGSTATHIKGATNRFKRALVIGAQTIRVERIQKKYNINFIRLIRVAEYIFPYNKIHLTIRQLSYLAGGNMMSVFILHRMHEAKQPSIKGHQFAMLSLDVLKCFFVKKQ